MKISKIKLELEMSKQLLRQQDLADLSGISRQTLSAIMNGRNCKPNILGKVAQALKVEPREIIED